MIMCQCRFSNCGNDRTPVEGSDIGGSYAYRGAEDTWEISAPSAHLFCESKTALKNSIFLNEQQQTGDNSSN